MEVKQNQPDVDGSKATDYFVGRQPILDLDEATYAYELLFRSGQQNSAEILDGKAATEKVLNCIMNVMGLNPLVGQSLAFINVPEAILLGSLYRILPRERVVIELLEDVEPTEEVVQACRRLKDKGYMLALDDFTDRSDYHDLLEMADIVN